MSISQQIRERLIATFREEQQEHVAKLNEGLLALEKEPPADQRQALLDEIFRAAHSLKGSARAVGMSTSESVGHTMEEILLQAKKGERQLTPAVFDLLYQALDSLETILDQASGGRTTPSAEVLTLLAALEEASANPMPDSASTAEVEPDESTAAPTDRPAATHNLSTIKTAVDTASTEENPPPPTTPEVPTHTLNEETIRVSISKLDSLMTHLSELLASKIRLEQRLKEVKQVQDTLEGWQKQAVSSLRRHAVPQATPDNRAGISGESSETPLYSLNRQTNHLHRRFANELLQLSLTLDELQRDIKQVRMLPLSTITLPLTRMVRDLARQQEKQVKLVIEGEETELDKRVLEQMKDPLIHLLRNAVDHGLDTPAARQAAGKPTEGRITLRAHQLGQDIVIAVQDDGTGLDITAIRETAVRRGLLSQEAADQLSEPETFALILRPGFSTSQIISDISGRGVGLDVVRQNVADLQGTLEVTSNQQQGTTFTITLPLSVASSRGLLVGIGDELYAIPFAFIERMLEIPRSDIGQVEGRDIITYQNRAVSLMRLTDLLARPTSPRQSDKLLVVIISVAEKRLGLIVDELIGEQEIVMKELGKPLLRVAGISGATILGSGRVVLVLNPIDLVRLAATIQPSGSSLMTGEDSIKAKSALVVDDSITTRMLEKNILEAAGYQVTVATNGREALDLLLSISTPTQLPHIIISDVNMPELDGFDLTHQIKQTPRLAEIPVILVTSLDSPQDKARGIEVGADAYVVKSNFDQGSLLDMIDHLL